MINVHTVEQRGNRLDRIPAAVRSAASVGMRQRKLTGDAARIFSANTQNRDLCHCITVQVQNRAAFVFPVNHQQRQKVGLLAVIVALRLYLILKFIHAYQENCFQTLFGRVVCAFLDSREEESCKAVIYQKNMTDEYVVVFLRGDYEVNETKLTNYLGQKVHPGEVTLESGLVAGFCGPYDQKANCTIIYDKSLEGIENLCAGANEVDYHYIGLNIKRDIGDVDYVDVAKIKERGICPCCGKKTISISRGIEVGNIFQLGTKYSKSMNMTYTDKDGSDKTPVMGCYGIGVGRLAASVMEVKHDEYGPVWPISIAPWQVHLCCMRVDDAQCKATADTLYSELTSAGLEVIYDDRDVRAGEMFADADLLGVPVRIVVGPKALKEGNVELKTRDKNVNTQVAVDAVVTETKALVAKLFDEINAHVD